MNYFEDVNHFLGVKSEKPNENDERLLRLISAKLSEFDQIRVLK